MRRRTLVKVIAAMMLLGGCAGPSQSVYDGLEEFESVVVIADGEPLLLDSIGWTPASIETSTHVYPKPVATALDVYYRVTADQIRLIANARDLQLRTTGAMPLEFNVWSAQKAAREDINEFLHRIYVQ